MLPARASPRDYLAGIKSRAPMRQPLEILEEGRVEAASARSATVLLALEDWRILIALPMTRRPETEESSLRGRRRPFHKEQEESR